MPRKLTHEEYVERVKKINPNIEVLGKYINSQIKILHRCKIDGYEWMIQPNDTIHGYGCPRCAGNEKYGHEEYVKRVAEINPNIEVVGIYVSSQTSILHRCKVDGCEWMARPNGILRGSGCPKCNESHGEKEISKWLDKHNISYQRQKTFDDCKDKIKLRFDFYLHNYNILVEYNGIQHYEPIEYFGGQNSFENQILRDNIKKEYCQKNNIILFEIPYYSDLDEELIRLYELIKEKHTEKGVAI